jgi:hypothetical protein
MKTKTQWEEIARIEVNTLLYIAEKTPSDTFRMKIYNGESLKYDRQFQGKYARMRMRENLSGFPVNFFASCHDTSIDGFGECPSTSWTYEFVEELTPKQRLEAEQLKLKKRLREITKELKTINVS